MTREATPLDPLQGSRKRTLTNKAKEAANIRAPKKTKTANTALAKKSTVGSGPSNLQKTKDNPHKHTAMVPPSGKKSVEVEDIEDDDDIYQSSPPHNPNHILEAADEDIEVLNTAESSVPVKKAETAIEELSTPLTKPFRNQS
jgi:hypothetical protein